MNYDKEELTDKQVEEQIKELKPTPPRVKKSIFIITKKIRRRKQIEDFKAKNKRGSAKSITLKGTIQRMSKNGVKLKLDFSKLPYGGNARVKTTKYGTKILLRGALNNRNDCQEVMRFWQETVTRPMGSLSTPRGLFSFWKEVNTATAEAQAFRAGLKRIVKEPNVTAP